MSPLNPATTAFIFPGRKALAGRFAPADLSELSHIAQQTFAYADEVLSEDFSSILFTADRRVYASPRVWHKVLYLCQVALLRIFYESLNRPFEPLLVAGVGSGEIAALTAAGGLSFEDSLKVLAIRADAIDGREGNISLSEGYFTNLPRVELDEAISASGADLLAITSVITANAHGVSGEASAVASLASKLGSLTVAPQPLPSLEGSHLLASARPSFASALEAVPFHKGLLKAVASTTGDLIYRPEDMRASLAASLAQPVRYDLLIPALRDRGVTEIVSFGADLCLNTGAMAARMRYIPVETMSDVLKTARGLAYG